MSNKRKTREEDSPIQSSPLLALPPEIWYVVSNKLEPLDRTMARISCRALRRMIRRKSDRRRPLRTFYEAIAIGSLDVVKWLAANRYNAYKRHAAKRRLEWRTFDKKHCVRMALKHGRANVLEWFKQTGWNGDFDYNEAYSITGKALKLDRVAVLQWLKDNGYEEELRCSCKCDWIKKGPKAIEWLHANKYEVCRPRSGPSS